jgi:hypothetical protein
VQGYVALFLQLYGNTSTYPCCSHIHLILNYSGFPDCLVYSAPCPFSFFRIQIIMPRKVGRKTARRIAPNTVFQRIARRVREYKIRWAALSVPSVPIIAPNPRPMPSTEQLSSPISKLPLARQSRTTVSGESLTQQQNRASAPTS